jgi:Protein of unknown function (DUF1573)
VVQDVTIKNNGTKPIIISPSISGPDATSFSVPPDPITIARGETAMVSVTFDPSADLGSRTGSLDLKDANDNILKTLSLIGAVKIGPIEG